MAWDTSGPTPLHEFGWESCSHCASRKESKKQEERGVGSRWIEGKGNTIVDRNEGKDTSVN